MHKFLLSFVFSLLGFQCFSQFYLNSEKIDGQVIITWNSEIPNERITGYYISIAEEQLDDGQFPIKIMDSLSSNALGWKSIKRKSVDFFGLDIRHYSQWTDLRVITKGDIYTIGVQLNYRDSLTDKVVNIKNKITLFPFKVVPKDSIKLLEKYSIINPLRFNILSKPLRALITQDSDGVIFEYKNQIIKILEIYDFKETTMLISTNFAVVYEKPPLRPFPLGEAKTIVKTLGMVIGGFIIGILLFAAFFLSKAVAILNDLYKNPKKAKEILIGFLRNDRFAVYSILFAERIINLNLLNHIISAITARFLKMEIKASKDFYVLTKLYPIYKSNNILEVRKMKSELIAMLKSV